jgi:hypothetical protein
MLAFFADAKTHRLLARKRGLGLTGGISYLSLQITKRFSEACAQLTESQLSCGSCMCCPGLAGFP